VLRIDHVVYAVRDLDATAERFRRELGLDSAEGGHHGRWGTANRIVPFGEDYLELIAVVDADRAAASDFGRATMERAAAGAGWLAIAVATDDLDAVAARLDLEIVEGRRERPDGQVLRWRSAGLEDPSRAPGFPFFIAWDVPADLHPGRARAGHGIRAQGIAAVDVGGDPGALFEWLGGEDLPIRATPGPAGVRSVALATADGDVEIR
jgi:catechol 2,3-dioxygenase-like lactoylglutathione lyase family enzyme